MSRRIGQDPDSGMRRRREWKEARREEMVGGRHNLFLILITESRSERNLLDFTYVFLTRTMRIPRERLSLDAQWRILAG